MAIRRRLLRAQLLTQPTALTLEFGAPTPGRTLPLGELREQLSLLNAVSTKKQLLCIN